MLKYLFLNHSSTSLKKENIESFVHYVNDLISPSLEVLEIINDMFPHHAKTYNPSVNKLSILKSLQMSYPREHIENCDYVMSKVGQQIKMETDSYIIVEEKKLNLDYDSTSTTSNSKSAKILDKWIYQLTEIIHNKIIELIGEGEGTLYEKIEKASPKSILPYLTLFMPSEYAQIIAKETVNLFSDYTLDSQDLAKKMSSAYQKAIFDFYSSKKASRRLEQEKVFPPIKLNNWLKLISI